MKTIAILSQTEWVTLKSKNYLLANLDHNKLDEKHKEVIGVTVGLTLKSQLPCQVPASHLHTSRAI